MAGKAAGEGQRRHDAQLQKLLKKAAELFAAQGYDRTSMRDIAQATGMSLAGLYYYCAGKQELLFLIQDTAFGAILEALHAGLPAQPDAVARLRFFIANHLRYFSTHMAELKVCSRELTTLKAPYYAQVAAKRRAYFDTAKGLLQELQAAYGVADTDLGTTALFLFGALNWIYTWYRPSRDGDPEVLATKLTRLFLYGFLGQAAWPAPDGFAPPAPAASPFHAEESAHGPR
ncbi:MAG: TetR family transcriptional regulator [Candidatus Tectimicrobiota bacterium]|nr:MAG: TetR family transcriptional regulator [Candidatus Tectomicrobia bacterium]